MISTEGITGVGKTYLTNRAVNKTVQPGVPLVLDAWLQRVRGRAGLRGALFKALLDAGGRAPFVHGGTLPPAARRAQKNE
ncbi:hypothetical protein ACFU7T_09995 [Streptomyces sp. NPDC057555]|uniref:hypothetical protein n=1 Tax=Streptomyces sp. NPDC057555 TaxID=3346166 RepID=UPI0036CFA7A4